MSVLGNLGAVSAELGMLQQAADHFTAALGLKPEEWATGAGLLDGLGEVSYNRGRLDQALGHLTEAVARFREIGYRAGQSDTLRNLAGVHTDTGRYDQALELASEALELARQARTLRVLGHAIRRTEGTDAALPHWHAALAILADAGATPEADALRDLLVAAR
jgi:tetratricopeptide (TPR) repeat protein